ncbi:MAG: ATP-dependent helicase, partial [Chloroflexi bacterium]|nr:ATP-dependent helicase [Chloroflexota bacterium]
MAHSFTPRYSQEQILRYTGGRLGIAAVPGAGKTHILSALAAKIIQDGRLQDGQELLIVTLVNSAVDNFRTRIESFFDNKIATLYKYRVRTLHGLAHDIVREKPARVGLEERFGIIDEREAAFIRREAVNAWLASHSLDEYLDPALDQSKRDWVRRDQLPNMLDSLAMAFIRSSKDRLLTPEKLRAKLDASFTPLPLAELGYSIYADYQRALAYRGAVDFDDLIRLALTLLESDDEFLARLQYRYPFILEDEAQDSSKTQERILSLLSGSLLPERSVSEVEGSFADDALRLRHNERASAQRGGPVGNWVRVGDPNQAIFETFTTASPELLRAFIQNNPSVDMPESGRSQPAVIALANHLIDWVMTSHPIPEVRTALSVPFIVPVPEGDPQQNPPDVSEGVKFISTKFTPEQELDAVAKSVKGFVDSFADIPVEEQPTIAVLVPRNTRGVEVVNALRQKGIEPIELISSTSETRAAAGSLSHLLAYLADPQSARKLAKAYEVWRRDWREDISLRAQVAKQSPAEEENLDDEGDAAMEEHRLATVSNAELLTTTSSILRKMVNVENFVAPSHAGDWLAGLSESEAEHVIAELADFRVHIQRWLSAVTLPIDQLVLTLAQDVFSSASDLALAYKLALVLRKAADDHPDWRLPELQAELVVIAKNERRFIGFSDDD